MYTCTQPGAVKYSAVLAGLPPHPAHAAWCPVGASVSPVTLVEVLQQLPALCQHSLQTALPAEVLAVLLQV